MLESLIEAVSPPNPPSPVVEVILVFASNTEVLNVEDQLEELELPFELVPVPKEVNPNCGLAISFAVENEAEILSALMAAHFNPLASYMRQGDDFALWTSPLLLPVKPAELVEEVVPS